VLGEERWSLVAGRGGLGLFVAIQEMTALRWRRPPHVT
jgi:hypothetical protein